MPMHEYEEMKEKLVLKALDLAQEQGWAHLALGDLAHEFDMGMAEMFLYFEEKSDIFVGLGRMIDRRVLENTQSVAEDAEGFESDLSCRDALFDIMMERFDVLNEYRGGLVAILESFRYDPKEAVIGLPHLGRSMEKMLEASGIETGGVRGAIKVAGLTAIYLKLLNTWKTDESADLSKTMSALDHSLGKAERVVNWLVL